MSHLARSACSLIPRPTMYGTGMSHLQCGDMDTYIVSMFGQVV